MCNFKALFKYVLEGLAVGIVAKITLGDRITQEEVLMLALTASAVFAILDAISPATALGARVGTGIALGTELVSKIGGGQEEYKNRN